MLEKFVLVSRDEFANGLRELVIARAETVDGLVALYAERELRKRDGKPHRLFSEPRLKIRRAEGMGPQPVKSTKAYDPSVGSEGIVAQLITELCRQFPRKFLNHPGPDQIRVTKARSFFVVTDLVGSGTRARTYLEAAWKVRSVRSWWSAHFLRFEVITYAVTNIGRRAVESHHSKPRVSTVIPCPTISACFGPAKAEVMKNLCAT